MANPIAHGATKIHGSLAFHGFNVKVKIHHQIWKHAFPSHKKIIDKIGYTANIETQIFVHHHLSAIIPPKAFHRAKQTTKLIEINAQVFRE